MNHKVLGTFSACVSRVSSERERILTERAQIARNMFEISILKTIFIADTVGFSHKRISPALFSHNLVIRIP